MSAEVRRPEIVVDLGAIRRNVGILRDLVAPDGSDVMVVVKADGYGHGMVEAAHGRARGRGALARRRHDRGGAPAPRGRRHRPAAVLADRPGRRLGRGDRRATSTSRRTPSPSSTRSAPRSARYAGPASSSRSTPGLSRGGSTGDLWPDAAGRGPRRARPTASGGSPASGRTSPAATSPTTPPTTPRSAPSATRSPAPSAAGLRPEVRHLANSAGALLRPSSRFDLVRCGIAAYGLDPAPGVSPDLGLEPAMTVTAPLALTKRPRTPAPASPTATPGPRPATTRVGLVPLGYGDGVPRHAGNAAEVWVDGKRRPIRGRICMDQFVVDLGDDGEPARRRRGRAVRPGHDGRADRRRLGARLRHHPLRDRHPHGRPARAAATTGDAAVSTTRKVLSVAGGSPPVRSASPPPARRTASPSAARSSPSRRRRPHAVRVAALGADHASSPTTASTCTSRSTSTPATGTPARAEAPELTVVFVHGYSLTLDSWHFQRAAYRGLVRTVYYDQRSHGRSGRSTPGPRDHRAARPRPPEPSSTPSSRRARSCWSATRWAG